MPRKEAYSLEGSWVKLTPPPQLASCIWSIDFMIHKALHASLRGCQFWVKDTNLSISGFNRLNQKSSFWVSVNQRKWIQIGFWIKKKAPNEQQWHLKTTTVLAKELWLLFIIVESAALERRLNTQFESPVSDTTIASGWTISITHLPEEGVKWSLNLTRSTDWKPVLGSTNQGCFIGFHFVWHFQVSFNKLVLEHEQNGDKLLKFFIKGNQMLTPQVQGRKVGKRQSNPIKR